jgi:hypothetical protein
MCRRHLWLWSVCLIGAGAAPAAADDEYSLFAILPTNKAMTERYGNYLENVVDFDSSPFDHHGMRNLNAGTVGEYPFAGIHLVESDPNYMERHLNTLRKNLHRWVDPDFRGVVTIDYEAWWAAWDHTPNTPSSGGPGDRDHDFKDDWGDFIERYRPELLTGKTGSAREQALRESYEAATVRFLVETLRECKKLCPNAKWGYFNYPKTLYGSPFTPGGTFGYGDCTHHASQINDRLAPLWAELDVTAPRIFASRLTLPERVILERDNLPEQQYEFIASHVREAKRVAPHAICIPYGSTRYFGGRHPDLNDRMLSERNTSMQISVPREVGADGVVFWGDAMNDDMALKTAAYMNEVALPVAQQLWDTWYPDHAATSPPSASGAGAEPASTAGSEAPIPASIPAHLRIRYSRSLQDPTWGAVRQGSTRVSIPAHSPSATASNPAHRGGRIVGRRAVGNGDSPPRHRSAASDDSDGAN